jgi:L-ascorbate 6-phosphate lactonase
VIAVDPYLSDCCNRLFGFRRLTAPPMKPQDIKADWLLCSHAHADHFDPDSVPVLMERETRLLAAADCRPEVTRLRLPAERVGYLSAGDAVALGNHMVTALPCDHGTENPHALGFLLEVSGARIYYAGDTCFRPDYLSNPRLQNLDIAILPINGAFGNMDEDEAAEAAGLLRSKLTLPCHFWCLAEHGGNPGLFAKRMKDLPFVLLPIGESIDLR